MIYVITHKEFDRSFLDDSLYRIIYVGNKMIPIQNYVRDDTGDNIAFKNESYCELTGLYWIWKNAEDNPDDVVGLVHYRRYFTTYKEYKNYKKNKIMPIPLTHVSLPMLDDDTIILPKAYYTWSTLKNSYIRCHNKNDLEIIYNAIQIVCPDYTEAFRYVFHSHKGYYYNMIICKRRILNKYCEWLFPLLEKMEYMVDIHQYKTDYQKRVFGFMAERLLNVWIVYNNYTIIELPTYNTEVYPVSFWERNVNRIKYIIRKTEAVNCKKE